MYLGRIPRREDSLFFYPGEGNLVKRQTGATFDDFQELDFIPVFIENLNFTSEQLQFCEGNLQCLFDLVASEDEEFARNTLNDEKFANATKEALGKLLCGYYSVLAN